MKKGIEKAVNKFYDKMLASKYFESFFRDVDDPKKSVMPKVIDFIASQVINTEGELSIDQCTYIGEIHYDYKIPLTNITDFLDKMKQDILENEQYTDESCPLYDFKRFDTMKNLIARGYLNEAVRNFDEFDLALFSTFSETKVISTILAWLIELNRIIIEGEKFPDELYMRSEFCDLIDFHESNFFNLIFDSQQEMDYFWDYHSQLHEIATSLAYFYSREDYIQSYVLYNTLIDKAHSMILKYKDKVTLFAQNTITAFNKFILQSLSEHKEVVIGIINVKKMKHINKIWGAHYGDYLLEKIHSVIDKDYGIHLPESVFVRTHDGEFRIACIGRPDEHIKSLEKTVDYLSNMIVAKDGIEISFKISSVIMKANDSEGLDINNCTAFFQQSIEAAKTDKTGHVKFIDAGMDRLKEGLQIYQNKISVIRRTFVANQIVPFFQPVVSLSNDEISHYEVLARICDDKGCMSASMFIDILIEMDKIVDLDIVMLERVLDSLEDIAATDKGLLINLSPTSLHSNAFIHKLESFINKVKVAGINTDFEITEHALFDNVELLKELNDKYGIQFAIDDFGTGYSNLTMVSDLAEDGLIKYLKIDGSLISRITDSRKAREIVAAVRRISEAVDVETIAEFIDSDLLLLGVKNLGINYAQGYYLGRPVPFEKIIKNQTK